MKKRTLFLLFSCLLVLQSLAQGTSKYLARSVSDTDRVYVRNQAKKIMSIEFNLGISAATDDFTPDRSKMKASEPASLDEVNKLEKKLKGKPEDALIYNQMGLNYKRMKMARPALDCFIKAEQNVKLLLADNPGNKDYLEAAATVYVNIENYNEAITYLNELLFVDPENELASSFLPVCYMAINQHEHGVLFIDSALSKHPGNITMCLMKQMWAVSDWFQTVDTSSHLERNKRPEELFNLAWMKKMSERFPNDFRYKLMYEYFRTMVLTLKSLTTVDSKQMHFKPDSVDHVVMAELEPFFKAALERKDFKNKFIIYKCLGVLHALRNDIKGALPLFEKGLTFKPLSTCTTMDNSAEMYDNIIACHMLLKDTAAAEKMLVQKLKDMPAIDPDAKDYCTLAAYRLQRNDLAQVREQCAKAIALNPQDDQPHLLLAAASISEGNTQNAQQEIDLALTANKDNPDATLLLGIVQFLDKNFDYAYIAFESVLRNDPGNEIARELFRRYYIRKQ